MIEQRRETKNKATTKQEDRVIDSSKVTFRRTEAQSNEALYSIYA